MAAPGSHRTRRLMPSSRSVHIVPFTCLQLPLIMTTRQHEITMYTLNKHYILYAQSVFRVRCRAKPSWASASAWLPSMC